MKKHLLLLTAVTLLGAAVLVPTRANAQFVNGSNYIGPEIGLGLSYGGGVLFGGMFETPITNPGTVGPGLLGIAVRVDYWGWSDGPFSYSFIPIGAICDYHFGPMLSDTRWDPFVGLGLGYVIIHASGFEDGFSYGYGSGIFVTGQLGARYFFSPNIAVRAEYGFGYMPFAVGVDFRF